MNQVDLREYIAGQIDTNLLAPRYQRINPNRPNARIETAFKFADTILGLPTGRGVKERNMVEYLRGQKEGLHLLSLTHEACVAALLGETCGPRVQVSIPDERVDALGGDIEFSTAKLGPIGWVGVKLSPKRIDRVQTVVVDRNVSGLDRKMAVFGLTVPVEQLGAVEVLDRLRSGENLDFRQQIISRLSGTSRSRYFGPVDLIMSYDYLPYREEDDEIEPCGSSFSKRNDIFSDTVNRALITIQRRYMSPMGMSMREWLWR